MGHSEGVGGDVFEKGDVEMPAGIMFCLIHQIENNAEVTSIYSITSSHKFLTTAVVYS